MAKIHINNPKQVINGGAKKYYFKVKGLGGPKGDKGDTGATGPQGPQGPQGNAATVSVGSTTTLPVGQDATVQNVGTLYNAVLNFGIPQGPRGPQGATGAKGDKGDKGDQGNPGPQGEKGTNATVYVGTTSTLNPGSQATVYNSGTDSNAVLNFGIPKGEKGDTGPMPTIAQSTGQATDQVMSQKATTDALNTKQATITSFNKLSADLVTDSTTTNKFVTAEDKTAWNAKQDALTAGNNIDITDGVISTPAIAPEVVAELPATGEEGKLYLTPKAHTTQTATGNPIEATITEQAGQLESFQLDGDTYQQTYSGKNLLAFADEETTRAGIDITWQAGKATLSGKATSTQVFITDYCANNLAAGTYTFSMGGEEAPHRFIFRTFNARNQTIASYMLEQGTTSVEVTISGTEDKYRIVMLGVVDNTYNETDYFQLESGSTATAWEPYVGGTASPNPDYPQPIQTVTGEQTVTVVGKNLFDKANVVNGIPSQTDGSIVSTSSVGRTSGYIPVVSSTVYSHTGHPAGWAVIAWYKADKSFIERTDNATTTTSPNEAAYARVSCTESNLGTCQFEIGQPTDYAPYHATSYPISLGSIELCKIVYNNTFQDYIYKDNGEWKIHKTIAKTVANGSETWTVANAGTSNFYYVSNGLVEKPYGSDTGRYIKCNYETGAQVTNSNTTSGVFLLSGGSVRLRSGAEMTAQAWQAKLSQNNMIIYNAMATATDTTITDQTLIAQLEAIRTASLENGTNTITNTATGSNLAGDMEIGYFGFNPTNRYDKWLWLDLNNNYEQIGGE